jgi:hypothetical protein
MIRMDCLCGAVGIKIHGDPLELEVWPSARWIR